MGEVEELARRAVLSWIEWMAADGVFPDPEYDRMHDAMADLADRLGVDRTINA